MHRDVGNAKYSKGRSAFQVQAKSALKYQFRPRINFSLVVRFLRSDSNAPVRAKHPAKVRGLSKGESLGSARGLGRGALNFIVMYLVYIARSNKDNKAMRKMRKTAGLNARVEF
jgi:hypothetical protein